jgi:hypothetical protein
LKPHRATIKAVLIDDLSGTSYKIVMVTAFGAEFSCFSDLVRFDQKLANLSQCLY